MKKRKVTLFTAGVLCAASMVTGVVAAGVVQKIQAELRPDFTIKIDGEVARFQNAQGEEVYPILYDGTTYLPVRAIGQMMNKTVYWNEQEKLIELKETTVTDADVIINDTDGTAGKDHVTPPTPTPKPTPRPTSEVPIPEAMPDWDPPKAKPDFEPDAGKKVDTTNFIGEEKAKEIALNRAGFAADGVIFDKVELDKERGVWIYEVEFQKGNTEYSADVNAEDGTIVTWESEIDYD